LREEFIPEKRTPERKIEKVDTSSETSKRSIKWKAGPDPKNNAIHTTSKLSAFLGVNIVSVHEVVVALDTKNSSY
jgi:hypothetical protein